MPGIYLKPWWQRNSFGGGGLGVSMVPLKCSMPWCNWEFLCVQSKTASGDPCTSFDKKPLQPVVGNGWCTMCCFDLHKNSLPADDCKRDQALALSRSIEVTPISCDGD